jgi:hypothetical protein
MYRSDDDDYRRLAYLELLATLKPAAPPRLTAPISDEQKQEAIRRYHTAYLMRRDLNRYGDLD